MYETYEAYGNQANYVGSLTFGRLQMHPKMQGMSYEVFLYGVGHKVLASSFGFIFDISSLLSSVLKGLSGFGGNADYLIKSFFQMFHTKHHILNLKHGTRTEN